MKRTQYRDERALHTNWNETQASRAITIPPEVFSSIAESEWPLYLDAIRNIYFPNGTHIVTRDLDEYLTIVWELYFSEVLHTNTIDIRYSYPWKYRFGSICQVVRTDHSLIQVNPLLQHTHVPECVLITTIAHELAHYTHGFGSSLPRRYRHPHAGNVVEHELQQRGLSTELCEAKKWIEDVWFPFYTVARLSNWRGMVEGRIPRQRRLRIHEPSETAIAALLPDGASLKVEEAKITFPLSYTRMIEV